VPEFWRLQSEQGPQRQQNVLVGSLWTSQNQLTQT